MLRPWYSDAVETLRWVVGVGAGDCGRLCEVDDDMAGRVPLAGTKPDRVIFDGCRVGDANRFVVGVGRGRLLLLLVLLLDGLDGVNPEPILLLRVGDCPGTGREPALLRVGDWPGTGRAGDPNLALVWLWERPGRSVCWVSPIHLVLSKLFW